MNVNSVTDYCYLSDTDQQYYQDPTSGYLYAWNASTQQYVLLDASSMQSSMLSEVEQRKQQHLVIFENGDSEIKTEGEASFMQGRRPQQEDRHVLLPNFKLPLETDNGPRLHEISLPTCHYFALFDGHSGRRASDYCGDYLHHVLFKHLAASIKQTAVEYVDRLYSNCSANEGQGDDTGHVLETGFVEDATVDTSKAELNVAECDSLSNSVNLVKFSENAACINEGTSSSGDIVEGASDAFGKRRCLFKSDCPIVDCPDSSHPSLMVNTDSTQSDSTCVSSEVVECDVQKSDAHQAQPPEVNSSSCDHTTADNDSSNDNVHSNCTDIGNMETDNIQSKLSTESITEKCHDISLKEESILPDICVSCSAEKEEIIGTVTQDPQPSNGNVCIGDGYSEENKSCINGGSCCDTSECGVTDCAAKDEVNCPLIALTDVAIEMAICDAYEETDKLFSAKYRISQDGCTAVCALIVNNDLYVSWVGDSRAVIAVRDENKGKCIAQVLTVDHKPNLPAERERIEARGGKVLLVGPVYRVAPSDYEERCKDLKKQQCYQGVAPKKPPVALAVSRAFGDRELKDKGILTSVPEIRKVTLSDSVKFMILACDGVWEVLSSQSVVSIVDRIGNDPKAASSAIIKSAFKLGSEDNLTCLVVFFDRIARHTPDAAPAY